MELTDRVSVVLTEHGAEILNSTNAHLKISIPSIKWKTDFKKNDLYINSLASLFRLFGDHCGVGNKIAFKRLKKI